MKYRTFAAKEVILSEGDFSSEMYFIRRGRCASPRGTPSWPSWARGATSARWARWPRAPDGLRTGHRPGARLCARSQRGAGDDGSVARGRAAGGGGGHQPARGAPDPDPGAAGGNGGGRAGGGVAGVRERDGREDRLLSGQAGRGDRQRGGGERRLLLPEVGRSG